MSATARQEDYGGAIQRREFAQLLDANAVLLEQRDAPLVTLETMAKVVRPLMEPEDRALADDALDSLHEPSEALKRLRPVLAKHRSYSQRLANEQERLKRGKEGAWIDPRGRRRRDDGRIPAGVNVVEIDEDGRVWGQDHGDDGDPLAGRF